MKKINIVLLSIILVIIMIFGLGYLTRYMYDLKETNINEKIVIKFKGKEDNFLLDLNTKEFNIFKGEYIEINNSKLNIETKIYSPNGNFYFKMSGIFNSNNNKMINRAWLYPNNYFNAFWTKDSKYLIRMDGHVVRLFGLFFSTPTVQQVIHIIEPETKKSKQILLFDENLKLLEIESILGYVE
ncbi:hypothetical protein HUU51_03090 [Candidatus Gracilibacteria bacterium]|nr:hypothetical protein [Candidatus Gracilibacteria bacterium]